VGARSAEALARAADLEVGVVVEAHTDPAPYLAAWKSSDGEPRVAFLDDGELGDPAGTAARIGAASGAQVDVWLALRRSSDLPRLAEAAERLRQEGP
jgi:hypothetical protein